jgi:4-amino-4-deoxy-L-arabinose transferase-like glycosyltransferase
MTPSHSFPVLTGWRGLLAVLLLWAFFAQTVTGLVAQSPTVDEQAHLMRGYLYLKLGTPVFKIGHPVLADTLAAVPLWALTNLDIPADPAAFQSNDWGNYSDHFVWRPGINVELVFFLSRLTVVAIGMAFAALVFRWASRVWGMGAGLVALALFVFDPTIVAHSELVTHDVPVGFFYFAATYGLWRYLETRRARDLILTGVVFGLAQGSKFSALLLVPLMVAMVGLWPFLRGAGVTDRVRWLKDRAWGLLAIFAIGGLTLWALYRFDVRPLPGSSLPVPAASYFEDLLWEVRYFNHARYFFLWGQYSATGWWYYFPVAFVLKTPLPAMLLISAALMGLRRQSNWPRLAALLLPLLAYLLSTLVSPLDIGYRYFIPALPYLYVLAGRLAATARQHWRLALAGVLAWSAAIAVYIHPDNLAYFNELAGGPDNGWRYLVDSNIDWGQSLPALRDIVRQNQLGRIKLSYFGSAHPSYYGLDAELLPTADLTPEQGNPSTNTFYPADPAPGVYAISATNLQGIAMGPDQWDTFRYFRNRRPFARAGHSIFLYRVEPSGPSVDVVLSGLQVDELAPATFNAFGTNDVHLRWADPGNCLIIPAHPAWYVARGDELDAWGWSAARSCATTTGQPCRLYAPDEAAHARAMARLESLSRTSKAWRSPDLTPSPDSMFVLSLPVNLGDQIQFLGYELQSATPDRISLLTAWRVTVPPSGRRAIFVHLLAPGGKVIAQWDGLDVPVEGWRVGDTFVQKVSVLPPPNVAPGKYWIQVGMYNPDTMERLPVVVQESHIADRVLLDAVSLGETP